MTYSVWYFSNEDLGDLQELEYSGEDFEIACKLFRHHTTNVAARVGWTKRVIITDSDDCILTEWKYGQGITWPKEDNSEGNLK